MPTASWLGQRVNLREVRARAAVRPRIGPYAIMDSLSPARARLWSAHQASPRPIPTGLRPTGRNTNSLPVTLEGSCLKRMPAAWLSFVSCYPTWMEALILIPTAFVTAFTPHSAPKPHLISILQDDLGWYDSGVHNPAAVAWSGNITNLAHEEGVILSYHYSHWHCSPSRRSFLTGRLPIHHGEQLSANKDDDIDLRMTWISEKLAAVGYMAHWFGKATTCPRPAAAAAAGPATRPAAASSLGHRPQPQP